MTVYYEVFHQLNPEGAVILAFHETKTPMHVKDKACEHGNFQWEDYPELRVRKIKQNVSLEAFHEIIYIEEVEP